MPARPTVWAAVLLLASAHAAPAQRAPGGATPAASAAGAPRAAADPAADVFLSGGAARLVPGIADSMVLGQLRFRSIGPAVMSGRVSDIAVEIPRDATPGTRLGRVVYITSAGGGVWKTTSGGTTWQPLTDGLPIGSTGAIAVAASNPDVVWLGSGESNNLRSSSWGQGVWRSNDAGATWTHVGLRASQHIARIVIHPTDPDRVWVAAMGPLWAGGGERGVYLTTDGGRTWSRTLAGGDFTGATDLALDPSDPNTVYAVLYQRERKAYSFAAGGTESGIHRSTDGGRTWTALGNGLPTGELGRIGIAVAASQPRTLYATVHATDGGVFRSDDAGATWRRTSTLQSIPWFFGQIRVDPRDPERVYHLGVSLNVSNDGGQTWRSIASSTHADHHSMWIDPNDSNHLIIGNDGGLYYSYDAGATWDFAVNLPISTFYTVSVDNRWPNYWVYGGLQDNGTFGGPVSSRNRTGVTNSDWVRVGGGDGFHVFVDPVDTTIVYAESQNGALLRRDLLTDESKSIRPIPEPGEPPLRYNWSAPLVISPHDRKTLYFAANHVFKSTDRGDTWTRLGGDLTRALDRESLPILGRTGPGGLGRHDGVAAFGNISTLDESKLRPGLLYAGTDDGVIQVTRNDGATWTRIDRFPGVPELAYVSRVIASQHAEGTAYATFDHHRDNDFRPYVLRTTDHGATWTSIAANLPPEGSVQVIREHHKNPDLLFVGTEFGVFVTIDGGGSWSQLTAGLPATAVHDLVIHPRDNDLVVGTHGRGLYVLHDLSPLEALARTAAARRAAVFAARPAIIANSAAGPFMPGDRRFTTETAPAGALLSYYVPAGAAATRATLVVRDAAGAIVRELPAHTTPGVHRTTWDLRHSSPVAAPAAGQPTRGGDEEEGAQQPAAGPTGPVVLAGDYTAELRLEPARGEAVVSERAPVRVLLDPALRITPADYVALHGVRMRAYALQQDASAVVRLLEDAKERIGTALAGRDSTAAPARQARALEAEIDELLLAIRGRTPPAGGGGGGGGGGGQGGAAQPIVARINGVANAIGGVHFAATPAQLETLDRAAADLAAQRARADAVLARLPEVLRAAGGR